MAKLQTKVKNALDEARILVLGTQVLLGFQYRAFFEKGFDKLPPADRFCELAGLLALLVSVGALFLPASRHRIVEEGNDSEAFHKFTMAVMRVSLAPFAVGLALDMGVAGDRVLGAWGGAACAAFTLVAAVALWYGHFAHRDRKGQREPEEKMEKTPLEHRIVQVLTEARVVLPGAQALLGFQLAMVLMEPFAELPFSAKVVHIGALGCIALATIVLMAPAAYHRIVERGEDTERFHTFASRMVLLALALLAPGFAGDFYVVLVRADLRGVALPSSVALLAVFYGAWFGAMLLLRRPQRSGRLLLR
ncbi:MAG: DUF6328 family protein [Myxococcales bacterium]